MLKLGSVDNKDGIINMMRDDSEKDMDLDPYALFENAIRSPQTLAKYQGRLNTFFDFISIPSGPINERCNIFIGNCQQNPKYALYHIFKFVTHLKEKMASKKIVVATINNYIKPIKKLCKVNDINVKWEKVSSGLPKERKYAEDRAPTIEEIQKILQYPDRRIKAIVLTMISCGMRLGAWNDLQYKHIQPIKREEDARQVVAAKITIYAGSDEMYTSFITKEAHQAIEEWIDYRKNSGEQITGESWLLRNLWDVTTPSGGPRGLITVPKKLKDTGVKSLMERALRAQGIRTKLEDGKKRYEFATDHGFRKFFKTRCEIAGMSNLTSEYLLNHSTGISDSYFRPSERDLLSDYLKVLPNLTIYKDTSEILTKGFENERIKMNEYHNQSINQLRAEMESKFQKLLLIVDAEKINKTN